MESVCKEEILLLRSEFSWPQTFLMEKNPIEKDFFTHDCKPKIHQHPNQNISFSELPFLLRFISKIIPRMGLESPRFSCMFLPLHSAANKSQHLPQEGWQSALGSWAGSWFKTACGIVSATLKERLNCSFIQPEWTKMLCPPLLRSFVAAPSITILIAYYNSFVNE